MHSNDLKMVFIRRFIIPIAVGFIILLTLNLLYIILTSYDRSIQMYMNLANLIASTTDLNKIYKHINENYDILKHSYVAYYMPDQDLELYFTKRGNFNFSRFVQIFKNKQSGYLTYGSHFVFFAESYYLKTFIIIVPKYVVFFFYQTQFFFYLAGFVILIIPLIVIVLQKFKVFTFSIYKLYVALKNLIDNKKNNMLDKSGITEIDLIINNVNLLTSMINERSSFYAKTITLLHKVFDTLPIGIVIFNKDHVLTDANTMGMEFIKTCKNVDATQAMFEMKISLNELFPEKITENLSENPHVVKLDAPWISDYSVSGFMHDKNVVFLFDINGLPRKKEVFSRKQSITIPPDDFTNFIADFAHELRSPLSSIIGFSEILRSGSDLSSPDAMVQDGLYIHVSAVKLLQFIDDIIFLSRIGKKPIEKQTLVFKSTDFIDYLLSFVKGIFKEINIHISTDCDEFETKYDSANLRRCSILILLFLKSQGHQNKNCSITLKKKEQFGELKLNFSDNSDKQELKYTDLDEVKENAIYLHFIKDIVSVINCRIYVAENTNWKLVFPIHKH